LCQKDPHSKYLGIGYRTQGMSFQVPMFPWFRPILRHHRCPRTIRARLVGAELKATIWNNFWRYDFKSKKFWQHFAIKEWHHFFVTGRGLYLKTILASIVQVPEGQDINVFHISHGMLISNIKCFTT